MGGSDNVEEKPTHKEKAPSHIASDKKDKKALRETLSLCISPFDSDEHRGGELLNIITGQLAPQKANVDDAKEKGEMQLKAFCASWPSGFFGTIKKEVVPFDVKQKHILIGSVGSYVSYNTLVQFVC